MNRDSEHILTVISSIYPDLSAMMKQIADYFLSSPDIHDLNAAKVAGHLDISEASLTRFAKKCGCNGYREFLYRYREQETECISTPERCNDAIFAEYQKLVADSRSLVKQKQLDRLVELLREKKRIYIYGKGSSGLAAIEFKIRLMKIGIEVQTLTDLHLIQINSHLLNRDCLIIGISVSARPDITGALKTAKLAGASTVLLSAYVDEYVSSFCDEVVLFAKENEGVGHPAISHQLPILILMDALYNRLAAMEHRNPARGE